MEISEIQNALDELRTRLTTSGGLFDFDNISESIEINEAKMAEPGFWDNQEKAQKLISETNLLKEKRDSFLALKKDLTDEETALELLRLEADADLQKDTEDQLAKLQEEFHQYELNLLLSGEYDDHNALMEIHPGAGGTEAMDWGNMLLRMYQRYCDSRGLKFEVNNFEPGDEAGLKSVSVRISGKNAYGLLKSEHGVHRLVRISPFDSAKRRHTSFASVEVIPEVDDSIEIDIDPKDLRIDVYRSSGAGGQHINKTSSAVRITHIPTGIVTTSQAQRSQFQNRDTAMNEMRAKLFHLEEEKKRKEKAALKGEQLDIAWGSQIRSYVFHPYSMVKDHRTGYETADVGGVMDGKLDPFIYAYLQWRLSQENPE
ncbi:peptide chain release factor 2 [Lactobacillus delbrueckii subsp. bulgaricus]|nr:peptide chain release factor 2 [Lactobacillus delbrueckii subsp. bulgaricus]MCT3575975.1 peptide chain release factor 2 [Lactobacillus delbrueckii]MCT3469550.1 peptide chain release factor 2 [Lactobacillus delbrueckii subsp. bulgaricus]MCT3471280.1 peptide chain release factor 2 [Lactobacillus delbrueckii subsp. bulgaricus]MCT3472322.1 peptide chain release factor 2 [Lactobacillus delbrueckii subsp. bulgaricus]